MKRLLCFLLLSSLSLVGLAQATNNQTLHKQPAKTSSTKKTYSKAGIKRPINKTNATHTLASKTTKTSLNGQWRGFFDSKGDIIATGSDNTEYVLELDIQGSKVTGYSYSYFQNREYYVICALAGQYDKATKNLTVTEVSKVKGVTPPGWQDCLQTHILTYQKEGTTEALTGKWRTAAGQIGDCGSGSTTLIRKTLSKNLASYNGSKNSTAFSAPTKTVKKPVIINRVKTAPPLAKVSSKPPVVAEVPVQPQPVAPVKPVPEIVQSTPEKPTDSPAATSDINFETRNNDLLQTVKIENATVRVDLYDNGVVDGDSISLFYNGKLILSHQRLSEQAITLTLNVNTNHAVNELIMYAENLGEIPPNTALMVVTDGDNRYEVPITSDLKNSGVIRFIYTGKK